MKGEATRRRSTLSPQRAARRISGAAREYWESEAEISSRRRRRRQVAKNGAAVGGQHVSVKKS